MAMMMVPLRFEALHAAVVSAVEGAAAAVKTAPAIVTCRLTHSYIDGTAPYFTVMVPPVCDTASPLPLPALTDAELAQLVTQWDLIKQAASTAILVRPCAGCYQHNTDIVFENLC